MSASKPKNIEIAKFHLRKHVIEKWISFFVSSILSTEQLNILITVKLLKISNFS